MKSSANSPDFLAYILSTQAIRERTAQIYELTRAGKGLFQLNPDKLESTCAHVLQVIHKKYPALDIPYHSRWGHFRAGSDQRLQNFNKLVAPLASLEKARVQFDLVITSVLLDAGAGAEWSYLESSSSRKFSRSEGLGVASFYMFLSGELSQDRTQPLRADGEKLKNIKAEDVAKAFQVTEQNPLVGLEGRAELLRSLGKAVLNKREFFSEGRPGNLVDFLLAKHGRNLQATDVLKAVLYGLGDIWPGRLSCRGQNLGDVWAHPLLGQGEDSYVPFHKLSQWLTYSLIEPLEEAGFTVANLDHLTGLAEYRNGGLFVDSGLISLKDQGLSGKEHAPGSPLIIEWRALTVQLLDQTAAIVRQKLGKTSENFPLAKVLEGGTWWAGRELASRRPGSTPPFNIASDGTVF